MNYSKKKKIKKGGMTFLSSLFSKKKDSGDIKHKIVPLADSGVIENTDKNQDITNDNSFLYRTSSLRDVRKVYQTGRITQLIPQKVGKNGKFTFKKSLWNNLKRNILLLASVDTSILIDTLGLPVDVNGKILNSTNDKLREYSSNDYSNLIRKASDYILVKKDGQKTTSLRGSLEGKIEILSNKLKLLKEDNEINIEKILSKGTFNELEKTIIKKIFNEELKYKSIILRLQIKKKEVELLFQKVIFFKEEKELEEAIKELEEAIKEAEEAIKEAEEAIKVAAKEAIKVTTKEEHEATKEAIPVEKQFKNFLLKITNKINEIENIEYVKNNKIKYKKIMASINNINGIKNIISNIILNDTNILNDKLNKYNLQLKNTNQSILQNPMLYATL